MKKKILNTFCTFLILTLVNDFQIESLKKSVKLVNSAVTKKSQLECGPASQLGLHLWKECNSRQRMGDGPKTVHFNLRFLTISRKQD